MEDSWQPPRGWEALGQSCSWHPPTAATLAGTPARPAMRSTTAPANPSTSTSSVSAPGHGCASQGVLRGGDWSAGQGSPKGEDTTMMQVWPPGCLHGHRVPHDQMHQWPSSIITTVPLWPPSTMPPRCICGHYSPPSWHLHGWHCATKATISRGPSLDTMHHSLFTATVLHHF